MSAPIGRIARHAWDTWMAGKTADEVEPQVLCLSDNPQIEDAEWTCNSALPFDVVERHITRGVYDAIVIVAPAHTLMPANTHGPVLEAVRGHRCLLAVNAAGECRSMSAADGNDVAHLTRGGSGPGYAALVMAMVPYAELESELAQIFYSEEEA